MDHWCTNRREAAFCGFGRSSGGCRGCGLRAGVRLIPEVRPANRSLSAIEPVSATAKRKLENGEPETGARIYPARAEIPKITDQRLGSVSVTRGNVVGSHRPGNNTPETPTAWLGTWIRTKIDGVRVRCSTIASCRLMQKTRSSRQANLVVSRQLFRKEFMIR